MIAPLVVRLNPTPAEWRSAMGQFPTGVTVVTGWRGDAPLGTTLNAFCSVSLEPPMLLICLDHKNPMSLCVRQTGVFGLNILGADDGEALARRFASGPDTGRFQGLEWDAVPRRRAPARRRSRVRRLRLRGDSRGGRSSGRHSPGALGRARRAAGAAPLPPRRLSYLQGRRVTVCGQVIVRGRASRFRKPDLASLTWNPMVP